MWKNYNILDNMQSLAPRSLLGRPCKNTVLLQKFVQENALNRTGNIDYNKYGNKLGIGFLPCTEKFVDNFLLYVYVPDYFIEQKGAKNKAYTEVGVVNKHIRSLLSHSGLQKCEVKAVCLTPIEKSLSEEERSRVYSRLQSKESQETKYYRQYFKIACADEDYGNVLNFLRSNEYIERNIFVKDIDVTMEYMGSFNRGEVLENLTSSKGFRLQDTGKYGERTILDNCQYVGNNCLTYMEKVQGIVTRCKIYNKMVQMLECKSVREKVGQHWKDWVCQQNTRLANARDLAKERGLTRAEVTFYCENEEIPSDEFMESTLSRITEYIPASLVYSTPYADTWKAYCDAMSHSLIVIDRTNDTALLVYSYNDVTKDISGQFVEKWSEKEHWCLANLTLAAELPIDVIELCNRIKTTKGTKEQKTKGSILEITGARYFKHRSDGSTDFTTRLVSRGGVHSSNAENADKNKQLLENAGFIPHTHCYPFLAAVKGNKNSKADLQLSQAESFSVRLPENEKQHIVTRKDYLEQVQSMTKQAAECIQEQRKPIEEAMAEKRERLKQLEHYCAAFSNNNAIIPLKDLPRGDYNVMAMKEVQTKFGEKFILLIQTEDGNRGPFAVCYSNRYIEMYLHENLSATEKEKIRDPDRKYLTLYNRPLAVLTITGWGRTPQRNVIVYCNMTLTEGREKFSLKSIQRNLEKEITVQKEQLETVQAEALNNSTPLLQLTREELIPYKHCKNLADLPLGSIYTVTAIGNSEHYGQQKLVLKLDDGSLYQAGPHVEENKEQLTQGCRLVIQKARVNISTRRKFAVCKIVQRGDWAGVIDYNKAPLLPAKRSCVKVMAVQIVEMKGEKRKLVLVEDGTVYKMKKSRLEDTVQAGQII